MLGEIWDRATATQPLPDARFVLATGVLALLLVLVPATWPRVRLGVTVVHEAGHALVAEMRPNADRVAKISIIPRGVAALGYTRQQPTEDRYLLRKSELLAISM